MNNKQYKQIEKHYNKLVKNKTIKTLNDALIYKLAIEKAFYLCGVVKSFYCYDNKYCGVNKKCDKQCENCELIEND